MDINCIDYGSQSTVVYATLHGMIVGWDLRCPGISWRFENNYKYGFITTFCLDKHHNWLTVGTRTGYHVVWDLRFQIPVTVMEHPIRKYAYIILWMKVKTDIPTLCIVQYKKILRVQWRFLLCCDHILVYANIVTTGMRFNYFCLRIGFSRKCNSIKLVKLRKWTPWYNIYATWKKF